MVVSQERAMPPRCMVGQESGRPRVGSPEWISHSVQPDYSGLSGSSKSALGTASGLDSSSVSWEHRGRGDSPRWCVP